MTLAAFAWNRIFATGNHIKALTGCALASSLLMLGAADVTAQTTFSDGTFADQNWSLVDVYGTGSAIQVSTGGNPGTFRQVTDSAGSPLILNIDTQYSYNPATQGAITSLNFGVDMDLFTGYLDGQSTGPVIEQNGNYFTTPFRYAGLFSGVFGWVHREQDDIPASDFYDVTGSAPLDFSANGGVMEFGFNVENSGIDEPFTQGYDNWQIVLNQANPATTPEPNALAATGIGILGVGGWLWRRKRRAK